jgi:putative FmdB family regulatory protein
MPTYEYVCDQGHRFEVVHGIDAAGPTECPICHSTTVRKAFAPPTIHFKGSGWAKKDRKATSTAASTSTKSESTDGSAKAAASSSTDAGSKSDGSKSDGSKSDGSKSDGSKSPSTGSGGASTTSSSSPD